MSNAARVRPSSRPWMLMDLSDDGRHLLTVTRPQNGPEPAVPSVVDFHDLTGHNSRRLASHGSGVIAVALDSTARIAVTGSNDGIVRAGPVAGEEPYLFYGHKGVVYAVAVSPDGHWIASGGQDGMVRLWPMPDFSNPPQHPPARGAAEQTKVPDQRPRRRGQGFPGRLQARSRPFPGMGGLAELVASNGTGTARGG
jgi:WD40 repeat protein